MWPEDFDLSKLNIGIMTDDGFQKLGRDIDFEAQEMIDAEVLDDSKCYEKNDYSFSACLELDSFAAQKILNMEKQYKGKIIYKVSSGCCDGSMYFAVQLYSGLKHIGCTNIKIYSEYVENPIHAWAHTKFIATGIMWNTNNWRKLHKIPMIRKGVRKNG